MNQQNVPKPSYQGEINIIIEASDEATQKVIDSKYSITVLKQAIGLQIRKSLDYQNPNSTVRQADYYRSGVISPMDTIHSKLLRIQSLLESDSDTPNFESIEDSFIDIINYASFAATWVAGKMEGQDPASGMFSNKVPK